MVAIRFARGGLNLDSWMGGLGIVLTVVANQFTCIANNINQLTANGNRINLVCRNGVMRLFKIKLSSNSDTATTIYSVQVNGVDSLLTISVPTLGLGIFTVEANVNFVVDDLIGQHIENHLVGTIIENTICTNLEYSG